VGSIIAAHSVGATRRSREFTYIFASFLSISVGESLPSTRDQSSPAAAAVNSFVTPFLANSRPTVSKVPCKRLAGRSLPNGSSHFSTALCRIRKSARQRPW
jgi:hypothetical protein